MQSSSVPPKFPIPWANSAGSANVRSVPTASQISIQAGAASLTDGFPPLNFIPVSAGGVPPFGQDMNGVLKQTTQWLQWFTTGSAARFDGAFASAIGGYPAGSLIMSNLGHVIFQSMSDNNLTDPNVSSSNWRIYSCIWSTTTWLANGSANAQTVTLTPAPTSLAQLAGIPLRIFSQGTNTAPVTLNINGLGPVPLVAPGSIPLATGTLQTGSPFEVVLQGATPFILMSRSNAFYDASTGGVVIQGPGASGANIALLGNGNATPNKYIRSFNGAFQVVNSAYNAVPLSLTDSGDLSAIGSITAGRLLRASIPAAGSGDQNAATLLGDFPISIGGGGFDAPNNYIWQKLPSGFIIQAYDGTSASGADVIAFPFAFPNKCVQVFACEGNPQGWISGTKPTIFGTQQLSAASFALYVTALTAGSWTLSGGVAFRYIAVGF